MKFSWGWLCDYLDPIPGALAKIKDTLTQAGIEVENCIDSVDGFEIVQIENFEKHPDSDHLNICKLVGYENKIVCGASNVRAGMYTVLAKIGAVIPKNGMQIQQTTIRGVVSHGMLCSPDELGIFIANKTDGIIDLNENEDDINKIMLPNGPIFDVGITPNRGDWLNVYGIAREMSALGLGILKSPRMHSLDIEMEYSDDVIKINDDAILSMYTMEVVQTKNQESPAWMKNRLAEVGINPKSAIVDITNYIAHALGQPLHAFNGDLVKKIDIHRFTGEFVDLKDKTHSIADLPAMICDGICVSVPGVIGGNHGKCQENSSNILLEAANYSREYIYRAQKMVTTTDASKKFFYGVDPEMTTVALLEGAAMIKKYCGGSVQNFKCARENSVLKHSTIQFPRKYLPVLEIDEDFAHTALNRLGFIRNGSGDYVAPSWRNDIETPENLLTEIVRSYDVKNIKEKIFSPDVLDIYHNTLESKLRDILVSEGFYEILTRDFMSKEMNDIFTQDDSLLVANPMSKQQFAVRNSLLPSMIEIFDMYMRYKWDVAGLFDIGPVFIKNHDGISERQRLCIAIPIQEKDWLSSNLNENFYTAKRLVEKIVKYCFGNEIRAYSVQNSVLKDSCEWRNGSTPVGWFGVFGKADVMKKLKMKSSFYIAEIEIQSGCDYCASVNVSEHETLTKDLSLLLKNDILIADVVEKIKKTLPDVDIKIFDLYPDGGFASEKRSVGLRLYWRNLQKVITSDELQDMLKIAEKSAEELGCIVRES